MVNHIMLTIVQGEFIYHQLIDNSQGIKIAGKDLENAIASSPILVPVRPDEVPVLVVSRITIYGVV